MSIIKLPFDLLVVIAIELSWQDLISLSQVCKSLHNLIHSSVLWRTKLTMEYPCYHLVDSTIKFSAMKYYWLLDQTQKIISSSESVNYREISLTELNNVKEISLIYPVPLFEARHFVSPYLHVHKREYCLKVDIYIRQTHNGDYVVMQQDIRTTVIDKLIPIIGKDIPRVSLTEIPERQRYLYKGMLNLWDNVFVHSSIIRKSDLSQFLLEAKDQGYVDISSDSLIPYSFIDKSIVTKYQGLLRMVDGKK